MQDPAVPGLSLTQLVLGGSLATQAVLAICFLFSVMSWYVIAAKWWEFRRLARERREFHHALDRARTVEAREQAMAGLGESPYAAIVRATGSFMADLRASMARDNVTRTGLSLTQLEALSMTLETEVGEEVEKVGRMIPLLATIASSAPLLGLFGTVLGIMRAFLGIAQGGTSNIGAVAPGIAEALIATAAGLGAAIPAVVAYNVFTSRAQRLEGELERVAQDTIGHLGREGRL